jgi:hypothetical protein
MDFQFHKCNALYGLPERIADFNIKDTISQDSNEPYRLFAADHFNDSFSRNSVYGVIPMIHALG